MTNTVSAPPSPRSFGLFFSAGLVGYALLSQKLSFSSRSLIIASGVALTLVALLKSELLEKPNLIWYKLGVILQRVMSPIFMALFFFVFFSPLAILLRMFGLRFLDLEIRSPRQSYWVRREEGSPPPGSLQKQF